MQNAKDTFYEVLRTRLTALNPERTVVIRGLTRPGILVVENELESLTTPNDCFLLSWTDLATDSTGALPLVTERCEISYSTAGSAENGGLDRGRLLAAMDAELLHIVTEPGRGALKTNYSALDSTVGAQSDSPVAMSTRLWWSEPGFAVAKVNRNRISRTATVDVISLQEAGEL